MDSLFDCNTTHTNDRDRATLAESSQNNGGRVNGCYTVLHLPTEVGMGLGHLLGNNGVCLQEYMQAR